MTLDFICSNEIVNKNKINIPRGATHYKCNKGFVKFYYYLSKENGEIEKMHLIPYRAMFIEFDSERHFFNRSYGIPNFYDNNGTNILKAREELFIGNEDGRN